MRGSAAPRFWRLAGVVLGAALASACRAPTAPPASSPPAAAAAPPTLALATLSRLSLASGGRLAPGPPLVAMAVPAVELAENDGDAAPLIGRFGAMPDATVGRSIGTAQNGRLVGGMVVQDTPHLHVLPATRQRGFVWGTQELVALLRRSAAAVAAEHPGTVLRVGNLSRPDGGDIPPSVSHNSGRDADVAFLAFDRMGRDREAPGQLVHYDDVGVADGPQAWAGQLEFDTARNWALVRQWLGDPEVVVQWIFIAVPLRNRLLDHALRIGEPESLRRRAARVLVQPRDSSPHADHFHLRIACPARDRPACIDGAGQTGLAREAQVDALLEMYRKGSPAEQRYARELLSLPPDGADIDLPPVEGKD